MAFIYVITNNINGKQYVGQTRSTLAHRMAQHKNEASLSEHKNRPLYKAINKYGINHFSISVLEECSLEDLNEREIYWIAKLDTYNNGYNATLGGEGKGNKNTTFYDYKELANSYIELGQENKVAEKFNCSINTVRTACKEQNVEIIMGGYKTRDKYSKPVAMKDKDTNNILNIFPSCSEAGRVIAGDKKAGYHISQVCRGIRLTAYGYKWEWYNED